MWAPDYWVSAQLVPDNVDDVPVLPGVYVLWDNSGRVVLVGAGVLRVDLMKIATTNGNVHLAGEGPA